MKEKFESLGILAMLLPVIGALIWIMVKNSEKITVGAIVALCLLISALLVPVVTIIKEFFEKKV